MWEHLRRCDGPPCPRCGCQDVKILLMPAEPDSAGRQSWWGSGQARCKHCSTLFSFRELPPETKPPADADYPPAAATDLPPAVDLKTVAVATCPDCGETMKTSSTRKLYRYHKCPNCGKTTKTAR